MAKVTLKATKTAGYALPQPHLPHVFLTDGGTYTLDDKLASQVVELGGGQIIVEQKEVAQQDTSDVESKVEKVETKEKEEVKPEVTTRRPNRGKNKR